MNIKLILTYRKFQDWLTNKSPHTIVGRSARQCLCPLSRFLQVRLRRKRVKVGHFDVSVGRKNFKLPKWAQKFVDEVDFSDRSTIPAWLAITMLRSARR